jgi:hypothetical protein
MNNDGKIEEEKSDGMIDRVIFVAQFLIQSA